MGLQAINFEKHPMLIIINLTSYKLYPMEK